MKTKKFPSRIALAITLAAATAGCNMFVSESAPPAPSTQHPAPVGVQDSLPSAERLKVAPITAEELDCPSVNIAEGGATVRVGGADNKSVRYQFDINDVARRCDPDVTQFSLKIGISGLMLIGPAGKPGANSTDLGIVVVDAATKKPLYKKSYKVAVDSKGQSQGAFQLIADPIVLPLTRTDLDSQFDVTVGFGKTADVPADKPEKQTKTKTKAKKKPPQDQ